MNLSFNDLKILIDSIRYQISLEVLIDGDGSGGEKEVAVLASELAYDRLKLLSELCKELCNYRKLSF